MMFHYSVNVVLCGVIFITFVSIIWADCKRKSAIYDLMTGTITLEDYSVHTHCEWLIKGKYPNIYTCRN